MAKVKFGNIIVDMRGKVNGNVYAKNKGGNYCRVRVVPVNPQSTAQSAVRASFTALAQAWRALTDAQRKSWLAGVGNYARINNLGDSHNLTGNSLFVSLNKNLSDVGIAQIDECPTPQTVETVEIDSVVADNSSQSLVVTLGAVVPANTSLKVFASPAVSAGVSSIGSKMRQIKSYASGASATLTLTTEYLAKFGTIATAGEKIFIEIVPVNESTGQVGASLKTSTIVVA